MKNFICCLSNNKTFRSIIWQSHYYVLTISLILLLSPFVLSKFGVEIDKVDVLYITTFIYTMTILLSIFSWKMIKVCKNSVKHIVINKIEILKILMIRLIIYITTTALLIILLVYGIEPIKCDIILILFLLSVVFLPFVYILVTKLKRKLKKSINAIKAILIKQHNCELKNLEQKFDINIDDIIEYELCKHLEFHLNEKSTFEHELAKVVVKEIKKCTININLNK